MIRWLLPALVAGLVVFPAIAGAAATRAEYAAQADPFCAAANADINNLNKRARAKANNGRFKAAGKLLRLTGRRLSSSIDQVRTIVPPPGDEALIADWLAIIEQVAANNRRLGRAVAKERFGKANKIDRANANLGDRAHDLIAGFPFQSCA